MAQEIGAWRVRLNSPSDRHFLSIRLPTYIMVSSHLVEALSSPTDALLELYKTQGRGGQSSNIDFPTVVTKHFSDVFKFDDAFREVVIIVTLHLNSLTNLYRFLHLMCNIPPRATATVLSSDFERWSKTLLPPLRCIYQNQLLESAEDGALLKQKVMMKSRLITRI